MTNIYEIAELLIKEIATELKGQSHLQIDRQISVAAGPFIFSREGRHPCGLNIPSMKISKLCHAEIVHSDGRYWFIRHSKNPVFLNGRELERGQRYTLEDEDIVIFADVLIFQIHLSSAGDTEPVVPKGIWLSSVPYPIVKVNGVALYPPLSADEFSFLELLYKHAGHMVARLHILDYVWPNDYATEGQLDHVVHRVRARLKVLDAHDFIITQRNVGYKLEQPALARNYLLEDNSFRPEAPRKVSFTQTA